MTEHITMPIELQRLPRHHTDALFSVASGHEPLPMQRLPKARVLWVNQRVMHDDPAFAACGATRDKYAAWLLDQCAYELASADAGAAQTGAVADRYGGANIGHNGGSGRAAFINGYHVKGVGRTRLVSVLTDAAHASGGAYLEECVRETIFAELVAAEFPYGAVPTLAIIETGAVQVWDTDHGPKHERCCLLVRPAFVRPAHFERAPGFISTDPREGMRDAERVRLSYQAGLQLWGGPALKNSYLDFWPRWASQIAYAFAHRLPHAAYTSSNICLDGSLLDFGAMAAMPSWGQFTTSPGAPPTGLEFGLLVQALQLQTPFAARHLDAELGTPESVTAIVNSAGQSYQHEMAREVLRVLGLTGKQALAVLAGPGQLATQLALNRLVGHFQRDQLCIFEATPQPRRDWDLAGFWDSEPRQHMAPLRHVLSGLLGLEGEGAAAAEAEALAARCKLRAKDRSELYRERFKEAVYASLDGTLPGPLLTVDAVSNFIDSQVARQRRDGRAEPALAAPLGFARGPEAGYALFRCLHTGAAFALKEWEAGHDARLEEERLFLSHCAEDGMVFAATATAFRGAVALHAP